MNCFQRSHLLVALGIVGACSSFGISSSVKAYPKLSRIDEGVHDTSFVSFRKALLDAIRRKDSTYIVSRLTSDVQIGFGPDDIGVDAFVKRWLQGPKTEFWAISERALMLGCWKGENGANSYFACPFFYSKIPTEPQEMVVVDSESVAIYSDSSRTSRIIKRVSFALFPYTALNSEEWFLVKSPILRDSGYIEKRFIQTPYSARLIIEKRFRTWEISAFAEGD